MGFPSADNPRYQHVLKDFEDSPEGEFSSLVVVNPILTILDEGLQGSWEGCLSVPFLRGYVERPSVVRVEYLSGEGKKCQIEVSGYVATIFQHELDHLEGILYVDRIDDKNQALFYRRV